MVRRKPTTELLEALARTNRQLGRLGVQPIVTVDEARHRPDYEIREIVGAAQDQLVTARRALRGISG